MLNPVVSVDQLCIWHTDSIKPNGAEKELAVDQAF